jgi:hypothetical protein
MKVMCNKHHRVVGEGVYAKRENFEIECVPWETSLPIKDDEGNITIRKETGYMCPRCKEVLLKERK